MEQLRELVPYATAPDQQMEVIDFDNFHLLVRDGARVIIQDGGKIKSSP